MAKVTAAQQRRMSPSSFAVPELRKYPIHDLQHVYRAKGRLRQWGYRLTPTQRKRAWDRIAAAEARLSGLGTSHRRLGRPSGLEALPAATIMKLARAGLLRYFR
jgi:hypothetical protein